MTERATMADMRRARVPAYTSATTLELAGFSAIRVVVREKEFAGPLGLISYALIGKRSEEAFDLLAKELVLSRRRLVVTSVASIAQELLTPDYDYADQFLSRELLGGESYVFVRDFSELSDILTPYQRSAVLDRLIGHTARGGGVVIHAESFEELMSGIPKHSRTAVVRTMTVLRAD